MGVVTISIVTRSSSLTIFFTEKMPSIVIIQFIMIG